MPGLSVMTRAASPGPAGRGGVPVKATVENRGKAPAIPAAFVQLVQLIPAALEATSDPELS